MNVNLIPGFGFVQETATKQNLLPGFGFVNETVAAAGGADVRKQVIAAYMRMSR